MDTGNEKNLLDDDLQATLIAKLKKVNIKHQIDWISEAWRDVSQNNIRKSWKNIWPELSFSETKSKGKEDTTINLVVLIKQLPGCETAPEDVLNDLEIQDNAVGILTDDDIAAVVQAKNDDSTPESASEENDEETADKNPISHGKAVKIFENALLYVENHEESTPADIMHLRRWLDISRRDESRKSRTQKKMTDFLEN